MFATTYYSRERLLGSRKFRVNLGFASEALNLDSQLCRPVSDSSPL